MAHPRDSHERHGLQTWRATADILNKLSQQGMMETRSTNGILIGKPEGKSLGRPRHRRVYNIFMYLKERNVSVWAGLN